MPRTYVCERCERKYTIQEYEEDRLCSSCGIYLMPRKRVSNRSRVSKDLEEGEKPQVERRGLK